MGTKWTLSEDRFALHFIDEKGKEIGYINQTRGSGVFSAELICIFAEEDPKRSGVFARVEDAVNFIETEYTTYKAQLGNPLMVEWFRKYTELQESNNEMVG